MTVLYRIEDDTDRRSVLCTTYQMRNFYRQLGDGFFSTLDIMNYIQHHQIVKWVKPGNHLLDVCCGRGLLLPMLRYQKAELGSYTGVDIEPKNATYLTKRVTDNKSITNDYYPFPVSFVQSNVAEMTQRLQGVYDVIVYTSSIEHMQPAAGLQSLHECKKLSKPGSILILTCPNTPEDQDGYNTQYRAHVYEWKRSELLAGLHQAGFEIITEYGLLHDIATLTREMERAGGGRLLEQVRRFVPNEWLIPVFSPMFPRSAKEIGFVCKAI